jgi:tetratricopeptide (TPR) repeat protein
MKRNFAATFIVFAVALAGEFSLGDSIAADSEHAGHALGKVNFPISCSPEAQNEFNRAVALLHHMTYPQARQAFEHVTQIDPKCAMAHWGVAMTLFQPLWPTRPSPKDLARGWAKVEEAKKLNPPTERERLFIAAAEAFFVEPEGKDYWLRIRRWEQAMEKVYRAFPHDHEAMAFYALAHLAVAPSNSISRANSDRAAEILLQIYRENPDHPGAMHYLVHANDVPGRERESLEITRKYEQVAPDNPHALHMPTHIYTRLGDWDGVVRGNLRAADAALKYPAGEQGEFVWDEFPHAIEYLIYGYLQQALDKEAATQLKRLRETPHLEPSFKTAFHLASTQSRYALERGDWKAAAAIQPREAIANLDWDRFAWPEAIARFAHGLGTLRTGNLKEAKAEIGHLQKLEEKMNSMGEELFARNIRVLRLELSGWIAHSEGDDQVSVAKLREAADLEASTPKHPVTPGPTLPASEQLGDLLLELKQPTAALAAYKSSLQFYPRRFNSLLGAARAARASNHQSAAHEYYRQLIEVAGRGHRRRELDEAKRFVAERA